jgi:hypothetical protein
MFLAVENTVPALGQQTILRIWYWNGASRVFGKSLARHKPTGRINAGRLVFTNL